MSSRNYVGDNYTKESDAKLYVSFRPETPQCVIDRIIKYAKNESSAPQNLAVDVGCGNGQITKLLAPYFNKVVGVDISEAQIKEAKQLENPVNVTYQVSNCDALPFEDNSVQLVTVGTALHWFEVTTFYEEVKRILHPNGAIVVFSYSMAKGRSDVAYGDKITDIFRKYWSEDTAGLHTFAVKNVDQFYECLKLPFTHVEKDFTCEYNHKTTVSGAIGLIKSFSVHQNYCKKYGHEAGEKFIQDIKNKFLDAIGSTDDNVALDLVFNYWIHMGRK